MLINVNDGCDQEAAAEAAVRSALGEAAADLNWNLSVLMVM